MRYGSIGRRVDLGWDDKKLKIMRTGRSFRGS